MSQIDNEIVSFVSEWEKAVSNKDYRRILILSLKYSRKIAPEIEDLKKEDCFFADVIGNLIFSFRKTFPIIIEKGYEKTQKVKGLMNSLYSSIFSDELNGAGPCAESSDGDYSSKKPYPQEKDSDKIVRKIREIVEREVPHFFNLYRTISRFKKRCRETSYSEVYDALTEMLIYLIEVYPDSIPGFIGKLTGFYEKDFISDEIFEGLLKKSLDMLPYAVIFSFIQILQEMIEGWTVNSGRSADKVLFKELELILSVFEEYTEFYPNYFGAHIRFFYGIFLKFMDFPEIAGRSLSILRYYAKHADERVNSIFFELYGVLFDALRADHLIHDGIKKKIILLLHEIWSNGPEYVLADYLDDDEFIRLKKRQLLEGIRIKDKEFREISFEILTGFYMLEVKNELKSIIKRRYNVSSSSEKGIDMNKDVGGDALNDIEYLRVALKKSEKRRIFKPLREILRKIIDYKIYMVDLFLQIVEDTFEILEHIEKNERDLDGLKEKLMDNEKLQKEDLFFDLVAGLLDIVKF